MRWSIMKLLLGTMVGSVDIEATYEQRPVGLWLCSAMWGSTDMHALKGGRERRICIDSGIRGITLLLLVKKAKQRHASTRKVGGGMKRASLLARAETRRRRRSCVDCASF